MTGSSVTHPEVREGSSRWAIALFVLGVVAILSASLAAIIHVPYVVLRPGPITNVLGNNAKGKPLITVSGAQTYATEGSLDLTTVSVHGGPGNALSALDWVVARLDGDAAIVPVDQVFPKDASASDVEKQNSAEMVDSQQEAVAVALRALGKPVTERIVVADFAEGSAAKAAGVAAGDQIVAVGGTRTATADALRAELAKLAPSASTTVTVRRGAAEKTFTFTPKQLDGRASMGVYLALSFTFPFDVTLDAGSVGGPSGGLMFTLGVYDKLTPGALTAGKNIAGTGTIDYDGEVGPIGGIRQKVVGAREAGADWFLAPSADCTELAGHVPDGLHVVKVTTFKDALASVEKIASGQAGALPSCS